MLQKGNPVLTVVALFLLLVLRFTILSPISAQPVSSWITKGDQSKLLEAQPVVNFATGTSPTITFNINNTYQTIDGFGWTFTSGSAEVISTLTPAKQDELMNTLFDPINGLGASVIRIGIGATDMSTVSFTYNDNGENPDPTLSNFNISGTADGIYLIPLLKKMLSINPNIKILATPWTAPKWMVEGEFDIWKGGVLNPSYYNVYAQYFVKYLQAMTAEGIKIWAITPQNEPLHDGNDPSMYMTKEDQLDFINNHLGPALSASGYGSVKIICYDHNCDNTEYPIYVANNSTYVDGSAFHLYAGSMSALTTVKNATNKNVYFTEQYTGSGGSFNGDLFWHSKNIMIASTRNWSKTALAWNLATNPTWGPHTPGGCTSCKGANTIVSTTSYTKNVAFYTIGHFTKVVKPGAVRIETNSPSNLNNVAFRNPDGTIAMIVVNDTGWEISFSVGDVSKKFNYTIPAGAVVSFKWNPNPNNCMVPNLGADFSICGASLPLSLNSNTSMSANVTFSWYKNGTQIPGQTTQNCISCVDVPGTYIVMRDSLSQCIKRDTVLVSSSLPNPILGTDKNLCNPSFYNLSPSNILSFGMGTSWQWSVDYSGGTTYSNLSDETLSTLSNVRRSGRYRLQAFQGNCTSYDDVLISSSLPIPIDQCESSGPTSLVLGISNPDLNGTNYNWYSDPTASGAPLSGGIGTTSFSTPLISSSTTYYVKDMSIINGNVGPTTLFGNGQQWGCSPANVLLFTATSNFTLKAFKVPCQFFNPGSGTVSIDILDNSNNVRATFTSDLFSSSTSSNGTTSLYRITFNGGAGILIDQASWGSNLKIRFNNNCTIPGSPYWNDNGVTGYPFHSSGNIVTITGSEQNGSFSTSRYMFFYDWEITTGNSCAPLPVIANIGGCNVSVPITLIDFYAKRTYNNILLQWTTTFETNNDRFLILRSVDGINFETIGTIKGIGNSNSINNYSFMDQYTYDGKVFYQLAHKDIDGKITFSEVIYIDNSELQQMYVSPNPFISSSDFYINNSDESVIIEIFTPSGQMVSSLQLVGKINYSFGEDLLPGVYLLRVYIRDKVEYFKIMKI